MLVGANPTVTPLGMPLADNATAELNVPAIVLVIVDGPELPCVTVSDVGFADNEKSLAAGAAKKRPLSTALELGPALLVTVMVTCPLTFHTTYCPPVKDVTLRVSN